jgi:hypothetical protein
MSQIPASAGVSVRHERIDDSPPCGQLGTCLTGDLTGNGRPDVVVCGLGRKLHFEAFGKTIMPRKIDVVNDAYSRFETNVFWYENPGWERHALATERDLHLCVGGALGDLTGDGRLDLVVGQAHGKRKLFWYEQPADPRDPWTQHVVSEAFQKYHDVAVADVDDDGEPELVGCSQEGEAVFYYDVPDDPRETPWADEYLTVVDREVAVEGLAVLDVDGDGRTEVLAGTNVYQPPAGADGRWERESVVEGWDDVRVAVGDLDGDGDLEVVYAEGDSPTYGTRPAHLAWFDPPEWEAHVLREDLFCPHSLQVGDVTGNGWPDVYVGEMGLGEHETPRQLLFANRGGGRFDELVLSAGVPTHEAKLVDLDGDGTLDVVGKSYTPTHHVDAWYLDQAADSR